MTEVAESLVDGPGWAPRALQPYAGIYPLSVEGHVGRMVAGLVPGVTTVTIHARYFAIHAAVAVQAQREGLDWDSTQALLRKAEVVAALVTMGSSADIDSVGYPHGYDRLLTASTGDSYDLDELSAPGTGYSNNKRGFLGVYLGSELEMGMVESSTLSPGARTDAAALDDGLGDLLDIARRSTVRADELRDASHLSIARADTAADGAWLRRLLCARELAQPTITDRTRYATTRILLRSIQHYPELPPERAFRHHVAFGSGLTDDPVLAAHEESATWRGTLLRSYSVNAWRSLWAWLVNQINDLTDPSELVQWMADGLPSGTVGEFLATVPDTQAGAATLAAESVIGSDADGTGAAVALRVLAAGARRTQELDPETLKAFMGPRRTMLDPVWVYERLESSRSQSMRDFAAELTWDLLARAERVSLRKSRLSGGTLRIPSRLREKRGMYWMEGKEGAGPVGLRIAQLARILSNIGVIDVSDHGRTPSTTAVELLDLPPVR